MINEANEPSSACRLQRIFQVETSTPPSNNPNIAHFQGHGEQSFLPAGPMPGRNLWRQAKPGANRPFRERSV